MTKIVLLLYELLLLFVVGEGISGLAVSGKKQSRGGKGIKKPKKKVISIKLPYSRKFWMELHLAFQ